MLSNEEIGKKIIERRQLRNMNQKELADLLNVSYQSVSKWERGLNMPTLDILSKIAEIFDVTIDYLVKEPVESDISYRDVGLDTYSFHHFKARLVQDIALGERLLRVQNGEPSVFKMNHGNLKSPVYGMLTVNPGSKAYCAKKYGYDQELCQEMIAKACNRLCEFRMKPYIVKMVIECGNKNYQQLWEMVHAVQNICTENNVIYGGVEISSQPMNFAEHEYQVILSVLGVGEEQEVMKECTVEQGDVLIGIQTRGIESTSFSFVRRMLEKRPEMITERLEDGQLFVNEMMRPCELYLETVSALRKQGLVKEVINVGHSLLSESIYKRIPAQYRVAIDLSKIQVLPIYRYIYNQGFITNKYFPYRFPMGIGMVVVVRREYSNQAVELISKVHKCSIIGAVEKQDEDCDVRTRGYGKLNW